LSKLLKDYWLDLNKGFDAERRPREDGPKK